MKLRIFTSRSCSDGKEMYKRVICMCKVVVMLIKPVAFLSFLFPLPLSLLKLPFVYPQFWGRVGVVPYQGILTSTLVHGVGILSIFHLWIFLGGKITTKIKTINDYLFTKWQMAKKNLAIVTYHFFFMRSPSWNFICPGLYYMPLSTAWLKKAGHNFRSLKWT